MYAESTQHFVKKKRAISVTCRLLQHALTSDRLLLLLSSNRQDFDAVHHALVRDGTTGAYSAGAAFARAQQLSMDSYSSSSS